MSLGSVFITGTDTDVGKTWVSVSLMEYWKAQGLTVLGMKPIAAGCEKDNSGLWVNEDALLLQAHGSKQIAYSYVNPYALQLPVSPHIAAERAGVEIDISLLIDRFNYLQHQSDVVVVEGAGGWAVPLRPNADISDLVKKLNLPVVMVVGIKLGCLNHAALTLGAIEASGLTCRGWVGVQLQPDLLCYEENLLTLTERLSAPCLGVIPYMPEYNVTQAIAGLSL